MQDFPKDVIWEQDGTVELLAPHCRTFLQFVLVVVVVILCWQSAYTIHSAALAQIPHLTELHHHNTAVHLLTISLNKAKNHLNLYWPMETVDTNDLRATYWIEQRLIHQRHRCTPSVARIKHWMDWNVRSRAEHCVTQSGWTMLTAASSQCRAGISRMKWPGVTPRYFPGPTQVDVCEALPVGSSKICPFWLQFVPLCR